MISQIKLPYFPKVVATQSVTRFGALEINYPTIYDKPVNDKIIVRIDTLECLRDLLGDECFICRELLYTILAGEHAIYDPSTIMASFYRKYKPFTSYVNDKYFYGDDSIPILERVALPLRDIVNEYKKDIAETMQLYGGKFLVQTHDYLYYAFKPGVSIPEIKGAVKIC